MTVKALLEKKGDFVSRIHPEFKVQALMDQLEKDEASALVITKDGCEVLGIISSGDVMRGLNKYGSAVVNMPVQELMTGDVICADISDPMGKVYQLMNKHQIRHVPILNDGRLCGIIDMLDVVEYRLREIESEAEALKEYVAGRT